MILGTGIDLIEVARIEDAHRRFGERFLRRVLLPAEIAYCLKYSRPALHVAARFAAKEAVSKAFGTGIGADLGWQDIEIARRESGEPFVILHAGGARLMASRRGRSLHISLTHTATFAAAVAVLEGLDTTHQTPG